SGRSDPCTTGCSRPTGDTSASTRACLLCPSTTTSRSSTSGPLAKRNNGSNPLSARRSPARPRFEAGQRVGAAESEEARHGLRVEIERAEEERRGGREELDVHARVPELRELGVAPDLLDHAQLEAFLEGPAHGRG